MPNPVDEQQLEFLGELLGDAPAEESKDSETSQDNIDIETKDDTQEQNSETVLGQEADNNQEDNETDQDTTIDTNAMLREQILKLTEQLQTDPQRQSVQAEVKTEEGKKEDKAKETLQAFLTEDEVDRIIDEPQLLNVAFNRAISVMQNNIQSVIQSEVNRQIMVSRAVTDFYAANQDLAPYGKFVQFVMADIEKENPTKTYKEIFALTADETRKRLGLGGSSSKDQSRQQSQTQKQKPAFAGSKQNNGKMASKPEFFDPNAADMMNLL